MESPEATSTKTHQPPDTRGAVAARVDRNGQLQYFGSSHYGWADRKPEHPSRWWQPEPKSLDPDNYELPSFLRRRWKEPEPLTVSEKVVLGLLAAGLVTAVAGVLAGLGWGAWTVLKLLMQTLT